MQHFNDKEYFLFRNQMSSMCSHTLESLNVNLLFVLLLKTEMFSVYIILWTCRFQRFWRNLKPRYSPRRKDGRPDAFNIWSKICIIHRVTEVSFPDIVSIWTTWICPVSLWSFSLKENCFHWPDCTLFLPKVSSCFVCNASINNYRRQITKFDFIYQYSCTNSTVIESVQRFAKISMLFFWDQFLKIFKIPFGFRNNFSIWLKFVSIRNPFEMCEQMIIAGAHTMENTMGFNYWKILYTMNSF